MAAAVAAPPEAAAAAVAEPCVESAPVAVAPQAGSTDSPARTELLDRLLRAAREIGELRFLRLAVERVEAVQQDFAARSASQADADEALELLRRTRQPALIRQLGFYFSDANLRHDTFLRGIIETNPSGGGFVPITTLLGFNRMKTLGCHETSEVATAVEAAPAGAGLELAPTRDGVGRISGCPMPPLASSDAPSTRDECTVRIENFPRGDATVTREAVTTLCSSFGAVANVWLILAKGGLNVPADEPCEFLGTVEVEFGSKEAATAALAADPPPSWAGASLRLKSLADFRASQDRVAKRPRSGPSAEEEANAKRARIEEEAVAAAARFERGRFFRLDEVPSQATWREIKDTFNVYGEVVYVDHQPEENSGRQAYVRMRDAEGVSAIMEELAKNEGKLFLEMPAVEDADWSELASDAVEAVENSAPASQASAGEVGEPQATQKTSDEEVPQTDPYGGGDEVVSQTDPYGGGDEALAPVTEEPAIAPAVSEAPAAKSEEVAASPAAAPAAAEAPAAKAAEEEADEADDGLFVVDTKGAAMETDAPATAISTAGESAAKPSSSGPRKTSCVVVRLSGDVEEAYIQKMSLVLAERRAKAKGDKKGDKGKGKGKDGGKGKDKGKGKWKDGKDGKKGGKKGEKGGKRGKRDVYDFNDDSS